MPPSPGAISARTRRVAVSPGRGEQQGVAAVQGRDGRWGEVAAPGFGQQQVEAAPERGGLVDCREVQL